MQISITIGRGIKHKENYKTQYTIISDVYCDRVLENRKKKYN